MSSAKIISLLLLGSASLRAQPIFSGLLTMGPRTLFAVTNENDGTTQWRALGQEVDGYALVSYDAAAEALIVAKNNRRIALRLPTAKTIHASAGAGELLAIVRREIQSRDEWSAAVHIQEPQPYGDGYRILVRREDTGEARLIIITRQGTITDYRRV